MMNKDFIGSLNMLEFIVKIMTVEPGMFHQY